MVNRSCVPLFLVFLVAALAAAPAHAAFPGQNGKLVFDAYVLDSPEAGDDELFTIEPDGSALTRLTDNSEVNDVIPAFSPDGRTIAYTASPQGTSPRLTLIDADGTNLRALNHPGFAPAWSPDGQALVYSSTGVVSFDLFTTAVAGGPRTLLTQSGSDDNYPAWSPDGETVAFASNFATVNWQSEIYAMKSDGSEDWIALTNTFGVDTSPEWSPDGTKIVFVSSRDGGNYEIYVMNADGSVETRLTTRPDFDMSPQWSPDGTKIAWVRYDPFTIDAEIWTMNPDGSGQAQLTHNALVENLGDWQPVVNAPPDCSGVSADPASLWPPNKHLRPVLLSGATDPDGDTVTITVTGVTHDEGGAPGWEPGSSPEQVLLRAERDPKGDGRVYTIAFEVSDERGATCTGEATVTVPRHKQ
jgi:hypothetical protein